MSHNLNMKSGSYAFAFNSRRGNPWHQLGQAVDGAMTVEEAIKAARLDWLAEKVQACYADTGKPANGYHAIRRSDNGACLGVVGHGYTALQNADLLSLGDAILSEFPGAKIDTAGALGAGERVFATIEIPKCLNIAGDKHTLNLVVTNGHGGHAKLSVLLSTVRVVCQNTLNAAMGLHSGKWDARHTINLVSQIGAIRFDARKALKLIDEQEERLIELAQRRLTKESVTAVLDRLFPVTEGANKTRSENAKSDVLGIMENADNGQSRHLQGSAYSLLNAVTEYTDWFRSTRTRNGDNVDIKRAESAMFGSGDTLKRQAFEYIQEVTNGAPRMVLSGPSASVTTGGPVADPIDRLSSLIDLG